MASGGVGGKAQRQDASMSGGGERALSARIKEDGIRRELYENERKARENWSRKWGFFKNSREIWKAEAAKRGLHTGADDSQQHDDTAPTAATLPPPTAVPQKSSGVIGWRAEHNLELLVGPMYVSRRVTMRPPLGPEEPDARRQEIIFLG